jgi:ferredoxin
VPPRRGRSVSGGRDDVRAEVRSDLCVGHGMCYTVAPQVFEDDDDGFGRVRVDGDIPEHLEDDARRGAVSCPEHAIALA